MIEIMSALIGLLRAMPSTTREFAPGEYIFHRDDEVRSLHLVEAGVVQLLRHQAGGAPLMLQRAATGAILAEASIFSSRYHCDAVATAPTRLLIVRKSAVRDRLAHNAGFAETWLRHLAHEVQSARLRSEILSLRTVSERLEAWLAGQDGRLPEKGSWKSLSAEIGVSPEALYREIAKRRGGPRPTRRRLGHPG